MKRIILLMASIGILISTLAFAESTITVNWTPGDEDDLAGHLVYKKDVAKGATTGDFVLKKDGGTPNATVPMPTATVMFGNQPDGFYAITVTAFDTADNESVMGEEFIRRADTTPPVITLNGDASIEIERGVAFSDPGATASDNLDGDLTAAIVTSGTVDTNTVGTYTLTYGVSDETPLTASVDRTVSVIDNAPPEPPTNIQIIIEQIFAFFRCFIFRNC